MAVRWQRWQKGGRGGSKVAERLLHGHDSFLVLSETGERGMSDNRGTNEKETENGKKKRKRLAAFSGVFIILYSNTSAVICQVLMTDISILYVSEPDKPPNVNVRDWMTSLLSSVHNPPSVNPSISALIVGYQLGASIRLLVGG